MKCLLVYVGIHTPLNEEDEFATACNTFIFRHFIKCLDNQIALVAAQQASKISCTNVIFSDGVRRPCHRKSVLKAIFCLLL